ncbi:MAG: hypothetical protein GOV15_00235 [Candidatus Diapherotrites archaeon]|nr:hypothetical protein [Candidatus Diapherotrites archaeon]
MVDDVVLIKPCKSKATLEATLKRSLRLNLSECAVKLRDAGFDVLADTPFILVFKKDFEFTLFPSGKLLVKVLKSETQFKKEALGIYKIIGVFE